jgi:hypothetical protein
VVRAGTFRRDLLASATHQHTVRIAFTVRHELTVQRAAAAAYSSPSDRKRNSQEIDMHDIAAVLVAAVLVAAALVAACGSSTAPVPHPVTWDVELGGAAGFDDVTGEGVVTATLASFEVEIELGGLAAGSYDWELAAGTCAEPGGRIGAASAYEELTSDAGGNASGSATVTAVLAPAGNYHIAVFSSDGESNEQVRVDVACGDLDRRE